MIKPLAKPDVTLLNKSKTSKILQISGNEDMFMPKHISTKEAIVIVLEGSAIINIEGEEYLLKAKDSLIIPERLAHSFLVITRLKALVIMPIESGIEFID